MRKLGGEVMQFRGANMAEVAAFVRKIRQQLPAGFTETMLRQVSALSGEAPPDLLRELMGTLAFLLKHVGRVAAISACNFGSSHSWYERAPPARQAGWPEARWDVLLAAVQEWREVADMTDKQQGWQVLEGFPLSDEAVRLGALYSCLAGARKNSDLLL